jgi:hypothetical protein
VTSVVPAKARLTGPAGDAKMAPPRVRGNLAKSFATGKKNRIDERCRAEALPPSRLVGDGCARRRWLR